MMQLAHNPSPVPRVILSSEKEQLSILKGYSSVFEDQQSIKTKKFYFAFRKLERIHLFEKAKTEGKKMSDEIRNYILLYFQNGNNIARDMKKFLKPDKSIKLPYLRQSLITNCFIAKYPNKAISCISSNIVTACNNNGIQEITTTLDGNLIARWHRAFSILNILDKSFVTLQQKNTDQAVQAWCTEFINTAIDKKILHDNGDFPAILNAFFKENHLPHGMAKDQKNTFLSIIDEAEQFHDFRNRISHDDISEHTLTGFEKASDSKIFKSVLRKFGVDYQNRLQKFA